MKTFLFVVLSALAVDQGNSPHRNLHILTEKINAVLPQGWLANFEILDGTAPDKSLKTLLKKIRAVLPLGWTVQYDLRWSNLEIDRTQMVLLDPYSSNTQNPPPKVEPRIGQYRFIFSLLPLVSPAEYRQLSDENRKTGARMDELERKLRSNHLFVEVGDINPTADSEKAAVASYKALEKTLIDLPDYYFGDLSLMEAPYCSPIDPKIERECEKVKNSVIGLMTKYDTAK